jgi:hypothetical protein
MNVGDDDGGGVELAAALAASSGSWWASIRPPGLEMPALVALVSF